MLLLKCWIAATGVVSTSSLWSDASIIRWTVTVTVVNSVIDVDEFSEVAVYSWHELPLVA